MNPALLRLLTGTFFVVCLSSSIYGGPERDWYPIRGDSVRVPYWPSGLTGTFERNDDRAPSSSIYESIDKFQREQRKEYIDDGTYDSYAQYDGTDALSFPDYIGSYDLRSEDFAAEQDLELSSPKDSRNLNENSSILDKNSLLAEEDRTNERDERPFDNVIDPMLSSFGANDLQTIRALEEDMVAEASIAENVRRGARQTQVRRPGLLATVAQLTFEKVNETNSAIRQINAIINNSFGPETPATAAAVITASTESIPSIPNATDASMGSSTVTSTETTTPIPKLTRSELQGIIRRNLRGLVRLFNIEWQDAMSQSKIAVQDFQRDLGNQIRPYLEDNPNVRI